MDWIEYKNQFVGAQNKKKGLSPSTIKRYSRDYEKYIQGTDLEEKSLSEITAPMLETFIVRMIDTHQMSDRCAGNVFGYFNQTFDYAYRSRLIPENPMLFLDRKLLLSKCVVPQAKEDEERILTKEELAAVQEAIRKHLEKDGKYMPDYAILLAMLTGMRLGELAALKWSCIDDLYIHIDYSEHRLDYLDRKSEYVVGEPKNSKHRRVPITKDIRALLNRIRAAAFIQSHEKTLYLNRHSPGFLS